MLAQILQPAPLDSWISPPLWWENFVPAWVAFFAALFRPFFATASMKAIRIMTAVIVGYATLVPFMNFFSTDVLAADPKSMLGAFLAVSPLTTLHFTWFNFWLAMYVLGGWFARDVQVQRVLRDMRWWLVIVIALAGFALEAVLGHEYGFVYWATTGHMPVVMYETGGYLPMMIPYVIISFKLNDVIKPESRLGRFVLRVSPTTLGTILVGWCFGTLLVRVYSPGRSPRCGRPCTRSAVRPYRSRWSGSSSARCGSPSSRWWSC
ncbi:MAG: hypothetical protein SOI64_07810 [Bifidobacterium mongoliense]|jgi:hypothetical protein|uniref:hypothetical protein n=1 Tax=Bifidobacterium mongoliense TaxID=518643 RepID=UPI002F35AEB2